MLHFFAAIGILAIFALLILWGWVLTHDDRPGLTYTPPPPRVPDLELFDRDDPRHPDYYDQYEELPTVERVRGDMDVITPERVARIQRRIEAKQAHPLTLEISRQ